MPRPFGRDRLAGVRDGKLLLFCTASKGWRARSNATATSAEHPGTCVRWENELFEVEDFESGVDGSVTYTLRPWDERHAIRVVATYSPAAEATRSADARDGRQRVAGHAGILLLALACRGLDRARGRRVPPEKSFFEVEPADARQGELDRFHLLEPALSFLEPGVQAFLAERFGFDSLKWGRISAIFLLIAVGPFAMVRPAARRLLDRTPLE